MPHPVHDDDPCRSFVRELELAERAGHLRFTVMSSAGSVAPASVESMGANNYLAWMQGFHLTPSGHDRARCRVYEGDPPEPGEDDGKAITLLTFQRIVEILTATYDSDQLGLFLVDGGIPQNVIPPLGDGGGLADLFSLFANGDSDSRRIIRHFLGRWLAQELDSGPDADQERMLLADLARQGWYVRDGRLVRGEPLRRASLAPVLGGDLLSNFHPSVQEVARAAFVDGHRAAAVFEAFKAVEVRVKNMVGGTNRSGVKLMGDAFDGQPPKLALNDLSDQNDKNEQDGFAFIFKGAMLGIRNPKAHARFEKLDERRALDYLGLASLLMHRLDDASRFQAQEIGSAT